MFFGNASHKAGIALCFGSLFFLLTIVSPLDGISSIPIQYVLKDTLRSSALELAFYGFCVNIPVYLAFAFGLLRDYLGRSVFIDRVYILASGAVVAACFAYLAVLPNHSITFLTLLSGVMLIGAALAAFAACTLAHMTMVAQRNALMAPLSVTWNVAIQTPIVLSFLIGGWLVQAATPQRIFLLSAVLVLGIVGYGIYCQRFIEKHLDPTPPARTSSFGSVIVSADRMFWLAAAIIALFTFQPGWQTPLFFHVTNTVGLNSAQYGVFMALITAFTIVGNVLFYLVSRRHQLVPLLWYGTFSMVLQSPLPLLIDSLTSAYTIAMISGLMYGFAIAGYWALLIYSSPLGLESTAYTAAVAISMIGTRVGDLCGSWLYQRGGFTIAMILTTVTTMLIFPVIAAVSRTARARADARVFTPAR